MNEYGLNDIENFEELRQKAVDDASFLEKITASLTQSNDFNVDDLFSIIDVSTLEDSGLEMQKKDQTFFHLLNQGNLFATLSKKDIQEIKKTNTTITREVIDQYINDKEFDIIESGEINCINKTIETTPSESEVVISDTQLINLSRPQTIFDTNGKFKNNDLKNNSFWASYSDWGKSYVEYFSGGYLCNSPLQWFNYYNSIIASLVDSNLPISSEKHDLDKRVHDDTKKNQFAEVELRKIFTESRLGQGGKIFFDEDGKLNALAIQNQGIKNAIIYAISNKQFLTEDMVINSIECLSIFCAYKKENLINKDKFTKEDEESFKVISDQYLNNPSSEKLRNILVKSVGE